METIGNCMSHIHEHSDTLLELTSIVDLKMKNTLLSYLYCLLSDFRMTLKNGRFVSVPYLFYQPMDEKIKTWPFRFPANENPNIEKALFDWSIVLQYDVIANCRLISRKFSGMKFLHPSVRLTN